MMPAIPRPSLLIASLYISMLLCGAWGSPARAANSYNKLPPLEQLLERGKVQISGLSSSVVAEIQTQYDLILVRREQLKISREVKGHFEKAIKEAEKKFEKADEEITQSAITKLKLGLAGTLNDIARFESDIALAQLHLERNLGIHWIHPVDLSGSKLHPVDFPYHSLDEFSKGHSAFSGSTGNRFALKEAMIMVQKARTQFDLGRKNMKMTRALLVTEVANYDFGIGNEADLFEALMIYTRVLVGYYDAVHEFNISVYRFTALVPGK